MGFKGFGIGLLLIFIFSFAFITYAVDFASNNDAIINIGNDSDISSFKSTAESQMIVYAGESNDSLESFADTKPTDTDELSVTKGIFSGTFTKPLNVFKIIFSLIKSKVFGNNPAFGIIFSAILTTVVIIMLAYLWKLVKGGNPD